MVIGFPAYGEGGKGRRQAGKRERAGGKGERIGVREAGQVDKGAGREEGEWAGKEGKLTRGTK